MSWRDDPIIERKATKLETARPQTPRLQGAAVMERPPTSMQQIFEGPTGQFVKQAALPTLGAAGGAVLGGMTGPAAPVAIPALEALGSMGGEFLNQRLGITPESLTQIGLSGALPPAARLGMKGLQALPRALPGASAALQEAAAAEARAAPKALIAAPPKPSAQLFDELAQAGNPTIPVAETPKAAQKLLAQQAQAKPSLQHGEIIKLADDFKNVQGMTIQEVKANAEALNKLIRDRTKDDTIRGAYKHLRGAIEQDLEAAAQTAPQASQLKAAWKAYRRENAQADFAEIIETKGIRKVGEFLDQVNPNAIANWIKSPKQEFWRKSLELGELQAIDHALTRWAKIPTIPVKRGAPIGSGRRLGLIGLGAGAGGLAGGGLGAGLGALAADKGSELIAQALMSEPGRKALITIVTASGGRFGQDQAGLLAAHLTGGTGIGAELEGAF